MADRQATIRQILVITDGCSNVGDNPVDMAAQAHRKNMVVNVIGIVDKGDLGKQGRTEAMSIADAGGGLCRIVQPAELSATAQMMTHQTMQMTLQQVVNKQLLQVIGKSTEDLPPAERTKVMQLMDQLEEEMRLELVVLLDMSASMREKIALVKEAVRDLSLSLQARQGDSWVAVAAFPGDSEQMVRTVHPFSQTLNMTALESMWTARGGTPTGPAIEHAMRMFAELGASDVPLADEDSGWTNESALS